MAVIKESQGTKLILAVEVGLTASGAAKYAQRSISKMNPAVSDSDLLDNGEGCTQEEAAERMKGIIERIQSRRKEEPDDEE